MLKGLGNWLRTNVGVWTTALIVAAGVVGGGATVLAIAEREDGLREAQTGLAELSNFTSGLEVQADTALDHRRPLPADVALHREIADVAVDSARRIEGLWDDPLVAGITAPTAELAAISGAALQQARRGDRQRAAFNVSRLAGHANALARRIRLADAELSGKIDGHQRDVKLLTFGVSGAIALALVALIVTVATMRRRGVRNSAEREAAVLGERRLQVLASHGSDLITVLAPDGTVKYQAGAVRQLLGYEPAELEGRPLSEWLHPADVPLLAVLCDVEPGGSASRELRLRRRDGSFRTCEARATSLIGDELWNGIVLNVWDVTERKQLEQRLREQAFYDGLTSLPNRVLFNERLGHALVRGVRARSSVSVLLIDLDDFKSINDSLGHPVGDELLRKTARRLDETVRGADTVARLGGDEFAVILDETESSEDDEEAAWRILAAMDVPFELGGRSFPVSASIGIARAEPGAASVERLVRDADLAMYAAKSEQKGSFAVYHEDMHSASQGRLQLKADLSKAVAAGDQLQLHYQPVVTLVDEVIIGFEALLRWNHPTRGLVLPADFVPLAEETGAIGAIGRRALRRACEEASGWISETGRDLFLSVNVSVRQLQDESLFADVEAALAASGLAPRRLVLEVTESHLMGDVERAASVLRSVRALGVRIAVDDFGTGYSSLSQLERLPVDILKVDRELTGSEREERSRLLSAVMEIGNALDLHTIAEGIETSEQRRQLLALHYSLGQGYLFSPPVPADAVAPLVAAPLSGGAAAR